MLVELTTILGELGENERKAAVLEVELELKWREQEQHHRRESWA